MLKPRDTLTGTRTEGQLRRSFFKEYVIARVLGGPDRMVGDAADVFEGTAIDRLRLHLSTDALFTPVLLTDHLSNRVLAVLLLLADGTRRIAVNSRLKIDPEILAHALIEEFVHVQQAVDNIDFHTQKLQFPDYQSRPYEIQAKQIATQILGYEPAHRDVLLVRDERTDILYDQMNSMQ